MNIKDLPTNELSSLALDLQAELIGAGEAKRPIKENLDRINSRIDSLLKQKLKVETELMERNNEVKTVRNTKSKIAERLAALSEEQKRELIRFLDD